MTQEKLIIGNWKMYGRRAGNQPLLTALHQGCAALNTRIAVAPPALYLADAAAQLAGSQVALTAQDLSSYAEDGAYTGEISAGMLADLGVLYVLIGHSERRQYFAESNETLAAKYRAAYAAGLMPVLCVGETLAQRESGQTESVIAEQLSILKHQDALTYIVAYEPVWAIGTGEVASCAQIAEIHAFIKAWVLQKRGGTVSIRVLYGGSVKADNAAAVLSTPGVDGALVGGASLQAPAFLSICETAEKLIT